VNTVFDSTRKLVYADQVRGAILRANPSIAYIVDSIAPVDAKPVIHGKWLVREHEDPRGNYALYHCSECDSPNANKRNFCPECGAQMDGSPDV